VACWRRREWLQTVMKDRRSWRTFWQIFPAACLVAQDERIERHHNPEIGGAILTFGIFACQRSFSFPGSASKVFTSKIFTSKFFASVACA
jgi:hypothetical protein